MHLALVLILTQLGSYAVPTTPANLATGEGAVQAEAPADGSGFPAGDRDDVLIRLQGDAWVREGERVSFVLVVGGEAHIEGTVGALAVIRGNAILDGARVGDMMVVQGRAELGPQSVVGGDLHLRDAEVIAAPDAVVLGEVSRDASAWERPGLTIAGALFGLGIALAFVLAGMLAAALAPRGMRRAGETLTGEPGKTLLAALVVWIAVPVLAGFAMITVVAMPVSIAIYALALPALALIGYLVAGIRLGDALLAATRLRSELRPIGAAAVGLAILLGLGLVPYLGPVVNGLAVLIGGAALGLTLWRRARTLAPGLSA